MESSARKDKLIYSYTALVYEQSERNGEQLQRPLLKLNDEEPYHQAQTLNF